METTINQPTAELARLNARRYLSRLLAIVADRAAR